MLCPRYRTAGRVRETGQMTGATARIAVAVAFVVVAACASVGPRPDPPSVSLESLRVLRVADAAADVSIRLRLGNPNDYPLAMESVSLDITLDGRPAVVGRSKHIDPLPAHGEASMDIAGRVDVGVVATALMTLGSQLPVDYAVRGSAILANGPTLNFSRKGQIPIVRFDRGFGPTPQ